jgi:hypothetical protein
MGKLDKISLNPDLIYAHSFDASVLRVLPEWTTLADQEQAALNTEVDVSLGYYPTSNQENPPARVGRTYTFLLPGTFSEPIYFEPMGQNVRAVIISDNFNPLHAAWQCPQDENIRDQRGRVKPNYRVSDGSCRRCDPSKAKFGSGGTVELSSCSEY